MPSAQNKVWGKPFSVISVLKQHLSKAYPWHISPLQIITSKHYQFPRKPGFQKYCQWYHYTKTGKKTLRPTLREHPLSTRWTWKSTELKSIWLFYMGTGILYHGQHICNINSPLHKNNVHLILHLLQNETKNCPT